MCGTTLTTDGRHPPARCASTASRDDTATVVLGPGRTYRHYTLDKLGKCHECERTPLPRIWVDTLRSSATVGRTIPTQMPALASGVREGPQLDRV